MYLQPIPLQDPRQLVLNLMVADVVDLYGVDVQLRYDPSQLRVEDANPRLEGIQIAPGLLLAADERFIVTNRVDLSTGLISFAATLLGPAPPVSGEGVLATIAFQLLGHGPYSVEIVRAQLVSSDLTTIPVVSESLVLSAPLDVSSVERRDAALWGWWLLGIGGVLLILVAFAIVYQRRRAAIFKGAVVVHNSGTLMAEKSAIEMARLLAEQGRRAMQQGSLELAHELFSRAVERDPANSEAWLGKGLVAQQISEKRICFQRVLALDPHNPVAQAELQQLERGN
ncbi:MAG: hypothetical protein NZ765_10245 [Anaerolineae bacterium]|nr:hypothetical protein [Anaerolineae bacterium]MDW8071934.1 hypothetical protein [Anaerolineae bacterium]